MPDMIKKGQKYKTLQDIPVYCTTHWAAPHTLGYDRTLSKGEIFTVEDDPVEKSTCLDCIPRSYRKLHKKFVPWKDRLKFWVYDGYSLIVDIDQIENNCELVK